MVGMGPTRARVAWLVAASLPVLLVALGGCGGWFRPVPTAILPAEELYQLGESDLSRARFDDARGRFKEIVARHPDSSYAPRARFLIGEAFYREAEFDKAAREFEAFLAFYPRHQIADLVQYRLAMSYYDQLKPVEQDQGLTAKALDQFKKLVKEYPESRYAPDALAKIDICRGRLAQKELFIANYYFGQGNPSAARQRLELILKEYPRTLVVPETMFLLAEVDFREKRTDDAIELLRRLATDYAYTEFGRRAAQRLAVSR
jgi:outer membrane protein assembly factor BamD